MVPPVEWLVAIGGLLLIGGTGATGLFDPIELVTQIYTQILGDEGTESDGKPVSITNENVDQSDTRVEIHYHFHGDEGDD